MKIRNLATLTALALGLASGAGVLRIVDKLQAFFADQTAPDLCLRIGNFLQRAGRLHADFLRLARQHQKGFDQLAHLVAGPGNPTDLCA